MSVDPEARQTSNMALVVGIIVLVLIVGGAIAYMTSRPAPIESAPPVIIQDDTPAAPPQIVPVPVPSDSSPAPSVTINPPASNSSTTTTTTIEKTVPAPPAESSGSDSGSIDTSTSDTSSTTTTTAPSGY